MMRVDQNMRAVATAVMVLLMGGCRADRDQDQMSLTDVPAAEIVRPADGATFDDPNVQIDLAVQNVRLAPAGTNEPNTGHLHLFINRELTPEGEVIPVGPGIVHLGKAQEGHVLEALTAGEYVVIAVLGDWAHVRVSGAATDTVRFIVE
jgi:hypothetical protein